MPYMEKAPTKRDKNVNNHTKKSDWAKVFMTTAAFIALGALATLALLLYLYGYWWIFD